MRISDLYYWEIEMADGTVYRQWSPDGKQEKKWKDIEGFHNIVRASLLPKLETLPRHDCIIDINNGHRFVKRFGRGFLKMQEGFELRRYVNCIVTNKYRMWVFPDGHVIITPPHQEIRL